MRQQLISQHWQGRHVQKTTEIDTVQQPVGIETQEPTGRQQ
jgi:hypothetical protein